jgi:ABC-2 type transport system permease protein
MWAGTGALLAVGSWLALAPAIVAVMVLGLARLLRPRR